MDTTKVTGLFSWKRAAWGIAILVGIVVVAFTTVFARWLVVSGLHAGGDAVLRFVQHGTTTIDDFKYYPARHLTPGGSAFRFKERTDEPLVPAMVHITGIGDRRLADVLSASKTIAFIFVKNDTIVFERYDGGHTTDSLSQYFSVSKSITSALIGAAIDDGIIRSVDQPVVDFVPEFSGRGFDRLTIEHLLTMTSGTNYVENDNPFGLHVPFNYTSDIERMVLAFQAKVEPGSEFRYKSGDVGLLSLVLSRALAPKTITAYAQDRLWSPLGMEDQGVWSLDRKNGLEKAWCCLAGSARDLAKIGRLYHSQGEWNGTRVLSRSWIERSVQQARVNEAIWPADFAGAGFWNYGYLWWLLDKDEGDYLALGKDGQFLYVNPARRTVIVRLGRGMGDLRTSQWVSLFRYLARETECCG